MMNPFKEVDWNPGRAEKQKFARSLIIGFPCIALVLLVVGRLKTGMWNFNVPLGVGGIGAGAGILFLAIPSIVRPFYVAWWFVACCIGVIVGNLLLAVAFYVLVTGIGLLRRALGRDRTFRKSIAPKESSYWHEAERINDPRRYYNQF